MKILWTRTINLDEIIPIEDWKRADVPGVETPKQAATALASEPGFMPPWGGQCWLHVAIDTPENKHENGRPKIVKAYDVRGTPKERSRR